MRRARAVVLAMVLAAALAGCGSEDDADDAASTQPVTVAGHRDGDRVRDGDRGRVLDRGPAPDAAGAGAAGGRRPTSASASSTPRSHATTTRSRRSRWRRASGFTFSYGERRLRGRALAAGRGGIGPSSRSRCGRSPRRSSHAVHAQRERLVRLADRLRRESDRGRLAGARRFGPIRRGCDRPDADAGYGLPRLPGPRSRPTATGSSSSPATSARSLAGYASRPAEPASGAAWRRSRCSRRPTPPPPDATGRRTVCEGES